MPRTAARVLTVKLPPALEGRLEEAVRRRGLPKSELVRRAIERYVGDEAPTARSFAVAAGDLAGSISGPAGLASDARHLRGYGQ